MKISWSSGIVPALRGGSMSVTIATVALSSILTLLSSQVAMALTPNVIWSVPNATLGRFSSDGSSVLVKLANGFQLRRASDGSVERTLKLPTESLPYNAVALSRDKQTLALSIHASAVTRIELWSLVTGKLARTISIGMIREVKSLDFTPDGMIATYERFGYGAGGIVRVYRITDGSLVNQQGPFTRNSSTNLSFSPNGQYLAIQDLWSSNGVRVLRTSDWTTVLQIAESSFLVSWTTDSASLWVETGSTWKLISVPSGTATHSVAVDTNQFFVTSVTPDNQSFLASASDQTKLFFLRTTDGKARVTYTFSGQSFGDAISPLGTLFTYGICVNGTTCTLYAARPPAP